MKRQTIIDIILIIALMMSGAFTVWEAKHCQYSYDICNSMYACAPKNLTYVNDTNFYDFLNETTS